jgi:hypothetical protein
MAKAVTFKPTSSSLTHF